MSDTRDEQHGRELDAAGLGGLVQAATDPRAHLAEEPIEGTPGSYWPQAPSDDDAVDAARDRAVADAMAALEKLLTLATRPSRFKDNEKDLRARALMLGAVDRAVSDPKFGYLKRLRVQRSALLRERIANGATVNGLAVELGVTRQRIETLLNNNKGYISASRQMALEALREEGQAKRAQTRAARAAAKEQAAADRLAARVAEGRVLAARLAGGMTRAQLMEETGFSAQKLVGLLTAAGKADEEGQA